MFRLVPKFDETKILKEDIDTVTSTVFNSFQGVIQYTFDGRVSWGNGGRTRKSLRGSNQGQVFARDLATKPKTQLWFGPWRANPRCLNTKTFYLFQDKTYENVTGDHQINIFRACQIMTDPKIPNSIDRLYQVFLLANGDGVDFVSSYEASIADLKNTNINGREFLGLGMEMLLWVLSRFRGFRMKSGFPKLSKKPFQSPPLSSHG